MSYRFLCQKPALRQTFDSVWAGNQTGKVTSDGGQCSRMMDFASGSYLGDSWAGKCPSSMAQQLCFTQESLWGSGQMTGSSPRSFSYFCPRIPVQRWENCSTNPLLQMEVAWIWEETWGWINLCNAVIISKRRNGDSATCWCQHGFALVQLSFIK